MNLPNCHDCGAKPGQIHGLNCDTERCSVCGGQRFADNCKGHDRSFARWTGLWPGLAESKELGMGLNDFISSGAYKAFFIKPKKK